MRQPAERRDPVPIEDLLDFLTEVELAARGAKRRQEFSRLASLIEHHLLADQTLEFSRTAPGGREWRLRVARGAGMALAEAPSAVLHLAPLLFFLRHRAAPGSLLVIEEPERELPPEGQAKLLEALAILVNLGVKVILTTPSASWLGYLDTLLAATGKSGAARERQTRRLFLQDERAFLRQEQVGVHAMRDFTLHDLHEEP